MMMLPSRRSHNRYNQTYRLPPMNRSFNQRSVNKVQPNNIQRILSHFQQSPSNIASLATRSAGNISQTLSNVQQVLNVVQTAAPIVQEYGPIVKNLPAMYRMMKAFKEIDEDDKEVVDVVEKDLLIGEHKMEESDVKKVESEPKQRYSKESVPKLYI